MKNDVARRRGALGASILGPAEESCGGCGFDTNDVRTADVAVALTSLPHWWGQLLDLHGHGALCSQRANTGSWTALEHCAHVRDMLHVTTNRLGRIRDGDHPAMDNVCIDAPRASDNAGDPVAVLYILGQNAVRFVKVVVDMPSQDWWRTGRHDGST